MTDYIYDETLYPAPSGVELELVSNSSILESNLTGAVQTVSRPGERWRYTVTWTNLNGAEYQDVLAFFSRLNGAEHRARVMIYGHTNRGTYGGSPAPTVSGASQTGKSLNIANAEPNVTGWAKAGDFFRWSEPGAQIRRITADADSDASGNVTLNFMPAIRTSPADAAGLNFSDTIKGFWILVTPVNMKYTATKRRFDGQPVGDLTLSFIDDMRLA